MLFLTRHGCAAKSAADRPASQDRDTLVPTDQAACGFTNSPYPENIADSLSPFGYFFPDAPEPGSVPGMTNLLDGLADAMVENPPSPDANSTIPPVFTYLGQFIDHDITAGTDREDDVSVIDSADVEPAPRAQVVAALRNLRFGALNLDSLYGGAPVQGEFAKRLMQAMRWPPQTSKLWLGTRTDVGGGNVPFPADPAGDLLRFGRILRAPHQQITEAEIRALPDPIRSSFVNRDGSLRVQRAIIGDGRNDENLFVAQLHLAFARLHNRIVDVADRFGGPVADEEALFCWARRATTWIYQWLVLNVYLPTVCDPDTVARVIADGAPVYASLLERHPSCGPGLMVLPLEFSVAAFRFGHSMVRASYDWSHIFGRPVDENGTGNELPGSPLELLFAFTGNATPSMPLRDGSQAPTLPAHWGPEWDRLVSPVTADMPDRSTRMIDSHLALPLSEMKNEDPGGHGVLRNLMRRNLRRGHRLSVPSAQACIDGIEAQTGEQIRRLSSVELLSGATGDAMRRGGFEIVTPLWFYVLKEAEILGRGQHLGPLGSRLVAETLAGLVIHDPNSYWHATGSDGGRWHPNDGAKPAGEPVISMPALMRAALLM